MVEHAPFSSAHSLFAGQRVETLANGEWLVHLRVTPVDELGNSLGPGYKHLVTIDAPGFAPDGSIQDMLDGSYQQVFSLPPGALSTTAIVTVDGDVILEDRVSSFVEDPLSGQVPLWIVLLAILLLLRVLLLFVWALRQGPVR